MREIGCAPLLRTPSVSALAHTVSLNDNNVLGIAVGTGEAVGYVNGDDRITGWLKLVTAFRVTVSWLI